MTGAAIRDIARSDTSDIAAALDAAHAAKDRCAHTSATERANIVNQIADRMEANLELLGVARICNNGKPIREMRAADLPLAIDHFGYFTSCARRRAR